MGRTPKPYTLYQRDNGVWYYSINWTSGVPRDRLESRRSTGIETPARKTPPLAATRYVESRIAELKQHANQNRGLRFCDYAEPFYTERCPHRARVGRDRISPETLANRRLILDKHIRGSSLWNREMAGITPADAAAFRDQLLDSGMARGTAKRVMDILRVIFREAVINRTLPNDPLLAVPALGKAPEKPRGVFTEEELRLMFRSRPGAWHTEPAWVMFRIAAVTGMRSSEVRALTWDDIHGNYLTVRQAWKMDRRLGPPKWGIIRDVPIPEFLAHELADVSRIGPFVVHDLSGRRYSAHAWAERWEVALQELEIADCDHLGRPRPPHSLRHSLTTHLLTRGVSGVVVGAMLGHQTGLTAVQDGYWHPDAAAMESVREALRGLFVQTEGASVWAAPDDPAV